MNNRFSNQLFVKRNVPGIYLMRAIHTLFGFFFILCIGYIYYANFVNHIDVKTYVAVGAILLEGSILYINGTQCPITKIQRRLGDDKGFFNLYLPQSVARHAGRFFTLLCAIGLILLVV